MRLASLLFIFALLALSSAARPKMVTDDPFSERVEALLKQMTLQEKIGQLNLRSADMSTTGPTTAREADIIAGIKSGDIGTLFNAFTVNYTRAMQEYAMNNTRLQIPLFFGFDVIHGYRTIFPVPIAEASSWDLDAISQSTRIQATEAAAGGLHWTFAPMVDIARDPRWGRVVEGAGEDPYLGSLIAAARVRGIQGQVTPNTTYGIDELMGCVKHFAVYGAVQSGRDYNTVDESEMTIRETYLPPYKATVDAGVASVMTAFNELNGVPSTANRWLLQKILRQEWGFTGFVVTDYTAVMELTRHGIACDEAGASLAAKNAGVDLDMESNYYHDQLESLVNQGRISMDSIDDSVRLILRAKFQLGLFDDPFRYCDEEREKNATLNPAFLAAAQALAEKSMVLLRNEPYAGVGAKALPLPTTATSIALIGPLADSAWDVMGPWAGWGHPEDSITLKQGIAARMPKADLILAQGCDVNGFSTDGFQQALDAAKTADVVVLAMGESADMSGEASSRSDIRLPGVQEELILQVCSAAKGKPVVLVLMNGRPLDLSAVVSTVPAILETWFLGSMAGPAIANVLFGDVNPSGKLPMTFPRRVGQVPIYYNHKNTGRPWRPEAGKYCSQYLDVDNSPLFPFGWGLSYNLYEYSDLQLTVQPAGNASFQSVTATATVTNTGTYQGREVVQLYVRDETASTTRPVKELKGFQSVYLAPGASQTVTFTLTRDDLSFHTYDDSFAIVKTFEPGHFQVFVGGDSMNLLASRFLAY